jgi:hypothetical protein
VEVKGTKVQKLNYKINSSRMKFIYLPELQEENQFYCKLHTQREEPIKSGKGGNKCKGSVT